MAGYGENLYTPHATLERFAPHRFEVTSGQLQSCLDEIDSMVIARGEAGHSAAVEHGVAKIQWLREVLETDQLPLIMVWDDIDFQLKMNLGGLGDNEGSER